MMGFRTKDQRLRTDDQRPMTKIGLWSVVCGLRSSFRSPYSLPRRQAGVLRFPRWIRLETVRFLNLECIIFFTIIFSVFLNQTGLAEDASSLFARANESYKAQRYGEAALLYDEIARQGTAGGPIFYNSGNAYFKTGELGRAIVNYERALEWMPRDADLRANYRYAESLVQRVEGQQKQGMMTRLLQRHFQFYTIPELMWILWGLALVLAVVHLGGLYFRWPPRIKRVLIGLLSGLLIFYGLGTAARYQTQARRSIVIREENALFEPREDATTHFRLFPGNAVTALKQENGWMKVERFDGKAGWVKDNAVEKVAVD